MVHVLGATRAVAQGCKAEALVKMRLEEGRAVAVGLLTLVKVVFKGF